MRHSMTLLWFRWAIVRQIWRQRRARRDGREEGTARALTTREMEAYTTLGRAGFAFIVNTHSRETGYIVEACPYRQWSVAVRAFGAMEAAGTPASLTLVRVVHADKVTPAVR